MERIEIPDDALRDYQMSLELDSLKKEVKKLKYLLKEANKGRIIRNRENKWRNLK
tara:strand:+ start:431 stop:595 length:165 start_codon:yes stop_codon:yes gene_type:complete